MRKRSAIARGGATGWLPAAVQVAPDGDLFKIKAMAYHNLNYSADYPQHLKQHCCVEDSGTRSRVDSTLKLNPDIAILEIGANDGFRGVPPQVIKDNIDHIVATLQQHGVVVVLGGMKMISTLGRSYTDPFAELYRDIAARHDLVLIPFFLQNVAAHWNLNQDDGIHPTAQGYRTVITTIYPYVVKAIDQKRHLKEARRQ